MKLFSTFISITSTFICFSAFAQSDSEISIKRLQTSYKAESLASIYLININKYPVNYFMKFQILKNGKWISVDQDIQTDIDEKVSVKRILHRQQTIKYQFDIPSKVITSNGVNFIMGRFILYYFITESRSKTSSGTVLSNTFKLLP